MTFSARAAETSLLRAGIPFVRLVRGAPDPGVGVLLVRGPDASRAERVLDDSGWRYRTGSRGLDRRASQVVLTWDGGASVRLLRGLPAAPLPARALARLEDRLWRRARPDEDGVREAHPVDRLVLAAVQVARPGFPRPLWRDELLRLAEGKDDLAAAAAAARDVGVGGSLELVCRVAGLEPPPDRSRATLRDQLWRAGRLLQRTADSRTVTALLGGDPIPGHAVFRTRFAGVEVDSGRGVFLPVPFSEALLEAGLERIAATPDPVAADVGTGCGAVALALASARPDAEVHGVDVSRRALRWARRNADRLGTRNVRFHRGSLLDPVAHELRGRVSVVLTNVPYAPRAYRRASWDDTPGAVEGEDVDGLGLVRRLAAAARDLLRPDGWLVAQIAGEQADALRLDLETRGYVDFRISSSRAGDAVVVARASR